MKKIFTFLAAVLITATLWAQSPNSMNYQAVIRNSSNTLVTSTNVGMQISILQGSPTGTAVYVETQTPTTNANGLVSIEIGNGTVQSGDFTTIDWANGTYFIKTETDPTGGTGYTITGTSQLLSVPYALHAKTAEIATGALLTRIEALENSEPIILASGLTDPRDGHHYSLVKIGSQVWMAENLKYLPGVAGPGTGSQTAPYYYVYGYDGTDVDAAKTTANYSAYGVLYNWPAAVNACPTGWHLPSDAEWTALTTYLDGDGGKLKETGTTHWASPNTGATNQTGFTALPGGYRNSSGTFNYIGNYGYWWSATEHSETNAWSRYLGYDYNYVSRSNFDKELGFSVRCVRD
ncbi:MAG TPA: fibrobacter succinogenes major paralogous domain-containing protein [Aquaticitalea sp.]|nr:fibrobacter succinogenes major paralogous domain-containing protein [Aquaticitalea sp.]